MAASLHCAAPTARSTTRRPALPDLHRVRGAWCHQAGAAERRVAAASGDGGGGSSAGGGEDEQPPQLLGDWRQFRAKLVADSGA
jgi:hypothetical protein